jgi:predicted Zn-dependent protease
MFILLNRTSKSASGPQQVDIVDNAELEDYIRAIGKRLAATPDAGKYPYTFTLINDPSINAFALPGGPVFIKLGHCSRSG